MAEQNREATQNTIRNRDLVVTGRISFPPFGGLAAAFSRTAVPHFWSDIWGSMATPSMPPVRCHALLSEGRTARSSKNNQCHYQPNIHLVTWRVRVIQSAVTPLANPHLSTRASSVACDE